MGDPKKKRKKYERPKKRWDKERIASDRKIMELYGLKNKKELFRAETTIRKKRENARKLLASTEKKRDELSKKLLNSLIKLGLLRENCTLEDVLELETKDLLERRLQTIVWRKNFALTTNQARQFITHGLIGINKRKITKPSFLVPLNLEEKISYAKKEIKLQPKTDKTAKKHKENETKSIEEEKAKAAEIGKETIEEKELELIEKGTN